MAFSKRHKEVDEVAEFGDLVASDRRYAQERYIADLIIIQELQWTTERRYSQHFHES